MGVTILLGRGHSVGVTMLLGAWPQEGVTMKRKRWFSSRMVCANGTERL